MNVIIPTALRRHTGGESEIKIPAANVGDALQQLIRQHPDLRDHLLDGDGRIASYVNVFVNDQNIRDLDDESTELDDRDEVLLVPAIAGG